MEDLWKIEAQHAGHAGRWGIKQAVLDEQVMGKWLRARKFEKPAEIVS